MHSKKSVVVGLTGRLDSAVAAYLLKKQGFQVIGVGIYFCDPTVPEAKLGGPIIIESLDQVKAMADAMDITFYAVNAEAQYRSDVIDPFVEARLFGVQFCIESAMTKMIFEILAQKCDLLGATSFATGHYAKVLRSQKGGEFSLMVANDVLSDQSFYLSSVPRDLFTKVIFPLSDLRKIEAQKVGKLIGRTVRPSTELSKQLLFTLPDLDEVIKRNAAVKLFKEGPLIRYSDDSGLGDHKGVHEYYAGQKKLMNQSTGTSLDRDLEVVQVVAPRGIVYVDYPRNIEQQHLIVHNVNLELDFDQTKGREVWLQYCPYDKRVKGKVQFLNNGFAFIKLEEALFGKIYNGHHLSLATKEGLGAKIMGSAQVLKSGVLKDQEFLELPDRDADEEKTKPEKRWDFIF